MLGFWVGTAFLLGGMLMFAKARHHRRWAYAHHGYGGDYGGRGGWQRGGGGCGGRGYRGHHGRHGGHGGPDYGWRGGWDDEDDGPGPGDFYAKSGFGRALRSALDLREEQEEAVTGAVKDAKRAAEALFTTLRESRTEAAEALRGETVDEAKLDGVFAFQDEALKRARKDIVAALKEAHGVLDPNQRKRVAEWLGGGRGRWI